MKALKFFRPRKGVRGRLPAILTVGVSAIILAGCGGGGSSKPSTPTPTPTPSANVPDGGTGRVTAQPGWTEKAVAYQQNTKKWTFLVYMNGANDLEEFGLLNMNQMEQVGSTRDINVVVQFKRIRGHDATDGDWTNTRRYYVQKDSNASSINSLLLSSRENVDMGDWQTLRAFVDWGVANYPAEHYCLVLWNHGAGWRAQKTGLGRGVSYDDVTGSHIDTIQIPGAIDLGEGKKWDVLAFDSSLMQMAEVAYEIKDKTQYIVGSEESPPGEGYPYQLFLADLAANTDWTGRDFSMDIVQRTIEGYKQNYPARAPNITQSALDASKLGEVAQSVNDLGRALYNVRFLYANAIISARGDAEGYAYTYYHDLTDFTNLLTNPAPGATQVPVPDTAVQSAAARVRQAVRSAVIKNVSGSSHPNSNGLSIFLTSPAEYDLIDEAQANGWGQRYSKLAFAKDAPEWMNFLINGPQ